MPDYMYMLESRLSAEQRAAMMRVQELAIETELNLYLTGGAVRDLISGAPIRDLDFTVEGNPSRVVRELEKGGAKIISEDEDLRHVELIFSGDVDGSIAGAREDVYERPGVKPQVRWASIMEDLRRRDFSLNAIAISLNSASRGLLLDPTNGLADLENREVRALSIHSFTNQPVRLLRALRYVARMDFHLESRTAEWFSLALERQLDQNIPSDDVREELRQLAREEKPSAILKLWEARGLIGLIHPKVAKRHPDYEMISRILKARDDLRSSGLRPRLWVPVTYAILGKLKSRERAATLSRLGFRSAEAEAVGRLESEAQSVAKALTGRKTASPPEAFAFLEKVPGELIAFVLAESSNSKAVNKIRNYLQRWRPLWQALPAAALELEKLGMERGAKFDKVIASVFHQQLLGKGRSPEDRVKLLRKFSGIKEAPKKEEKKKPEKGKKKGPEHGAPPEAAPTPAKGAEAAKGVAPKMAAAQPAAKSKAAPATAVPSTARKPQNPAPPAKTKKSAGKKK